MTLFVLLIKYAHIHCDMLSVPCHRTRACVITFSPVFPWRVTYASLLLEMKKFCYLTMAKRGGCFWKD